MILGRFRQILLSNPDAVAIRSSGQTCSYGELDGRARAVARALGALPETKPLAVVVLLGGDPVSEIAAILGVIFAGGVAIPLEASQPRQHLARLIEHSKASRVLAARPLMAAAIDAAGTNLAIEIPDQPEPNAPLPMTASPDAPAYVCYTSGSTGEPKALVSTHFRIVEHARTGVEALGHGPDERHTLLHSLSTGAGHATLWRALLSGATLLPRRVNDDGAAGMREWLDAERATVLFCSPTLFRTFMATLDAEDRLTTVGVLRLVGERVTPEDFALFKQHFARGARFVNAYSITEAGNVTLNVLTHDSHVDGDVLPVGYAMPRCRVRIVDENGRDLPPGAIGEIVVEGPFVKSNWQGAASSGVFRTGDLGRMGADGLLTHLGRRDFQVKIRGFRVELEGVEAVLDRAPGVARSAAIVKQTPTGESMLVAYVAADARVTDTNRLRAFAASQLPDGSVPSRFVLVPALPLTASGKVDRRALQDRDDPPESGADTVDWESRSQVEQRVAAIWTDVLGHSRFSAADGFLAAGGDSLLAMRVLTRVRQQLGVDLRLQDFLSASSVAALGSEIERRHREDQQIDDIELARLIDEAASRSLKDPAT